MIDIKHLTFAYPNQPSPLFDDFRWRVERGEFWSVIGASGCGKSTLLHLIVGVRSPLNPPSPALQSAHVSPRSEAERECGASVPRGAGAIPAITVNGENVPRKKNRGKTGLVLQDYGLLPWATVRENVELGLRIRGFYGQDQTQMANGKLQTLAPNPFGSAGVAENDTPSAIRHALVDFWLERFGLASLRDKYPSQISGGQRQRVAIARTLVLEPDVLLMDEPFSALDAPTREDLEQLTLTLQNETKTTTVFVTHSIEEAVFLGRKILVLGAPPHRSPPRVVENPGAGRAAYRDEPMFLDQARKLRGMLKAV